MEIKYRSVKIQQETITDRLIETGSKEELLKTNQQVRDKVRGDFLKYREIFGTYQKACNSQKLLDKHDALKHLKAMTTVVTKVADVLGLPKTASHGLELSVPTCDGNRKSYETWKSQFNCWMYKYKQDEGKQLRKLRKALPKNSFWPDQMRPGKKTEQAWIILDTECGDQRKLMNTLLKEITYLKAMKNDSNTFSRYAARILSFVNKMEQSSFAVTSTSEAPFVMSRPLSKLDASDNIEFGREMLRMGKGENV